ncbi:hypothetical protein [Streptomyces sp. cg35]|uniref:hypothetical protein n=1 Tax=Streptomyces sp. cg35 TaxID=3421650 RepID=UPI003D18246C
MRGCITDDFTLENGRVLTLRGPVPGVRQGSRSGLFRDPLGLRRGELAGRTLQEVRSTATITPPQMNAGELWKVPEPNLTAAQPAAGQPWAVVGTWALNWAGLVPATRGDLIMWADPSCFQPFPARLRSVNRTTVTGFTSSTIWAGSQMWPVAQVMNGDEASVALFHNAFVENATFALWGLDHITASFQGFVMPLADVARPRTIGEAIQAAPGGDTIQAVMDAATATTVRTVIDEWSTP